MNIATINTPHGGFNVFWMDGDEYCHMTNETSHPIEANASIINAPEKMGIDLTGEKSNLLRVIDTQKVIENPEFVYTLSKTCDEHEFVIAKQISEYFYQPSFLREDETLKDYMFHTRSYFYETYTSTVPV